MSGDQMPEAGWRGILNHLLYVVQFDRELSDATIDEIAEKMVVRRGLTAGPEVYYQALSQALHAEYLVGPQSIPMAIQHDDSMLRDVIARLLPRLDARRPWPAARFIQLPVGDWPWEQAPTVATIRAGFHDVMGRTWHIFDSVRDDGVLTNVMVLRQRTGEVIALVVAGPRPADRGSTSFRVLEGEPAEALASFMELTGFTEDVVVPHD
jgi:hypothetical protein